MASIHRQTVVDVGVEKAWAALRTVGAAHELFAPVLADGVLNGELRRVRFANGMVVNERIVDIDDGMRRVVYSALDAPGLQYHHASMQGPLNARRTSHAFQCFTFPAVISRTVE